MARNKVKTKGAILVFVLGLVVLLGALCTRLMQETVQELRHVSQFHKQDDLRLHAESLRDYTIGVCNIFKKFSPHKLKSGAGWENPFNVFPLEPLDKRFKWSPPIWKNESGKLPLFDTMNKYPKVMKEIFACMYTGKFGRIDEDDGQQFYDALMDWQDSDDNAREEGAEDDYYQDLDMPYFCADKQVQSFDEFRKIKGFGFDADDPEEDGLFFDKFGNETENFKNFRESFSFYHTGRPNKKALSSFLTRFICKDDERLIEELANYCCCGDAKPPEIDFPMPLSCQNETLSVEIKIGKSSKEQLERGKAAFKLHAVIQNDQIKKTQAGGPKKTSTRSKQNQKLKYPFRLVRLRENENLID